MSNLNHFDERGQAHMVNVGEKAESHRVAIASGRINMTSSTFELIRSGGAKKGDVLGISRIAAIQGAKRTPDMIPLSHPIAITKVAVEFIPDAESSSISCQATVETIGRTGVEMEALMAVNAGLLTIYDMVKAVDRGMTIEGIRLLEKTGGTRGDWHRS